MIETINDQLKNISHLEHSRHRGIGIFFVNSLAAMIAYMHQPKKPKLRMDLKKGATKEDLKKAMKDHTLEKARLIGVYSKTKI